MRETYLRHSFTSGWSGRRRLRSRRTSLSHCPADAGLFVAIAESNLLWVAAQFRRFFAEDQVPAELREIADHGDMNVVFVPRTASRYYEYAPL